MSRQYCRYCDTDFICGRACRNPTERDRCGEWKMLLAAEKVSKEIRDAATALTRPTDGGAS